MKKKLKLFKFTADLYIAAKNENEAKSIFADESWDFASNADCEEVSDPKMILLYSDILNN